MPAVGALRAAMRPTHMRMKNLLSIIVFITLFSLLYVYQQTEIFHLAYDVQKKQSLVDDLLDKNTVLRYNIDRKSSLVQIGDRVSANKDFQMPDAYRLVRVTAPGRRSGVQVPAVRETLAARIFGVKRQAQAQIINP